ncbi:hypothetical protein BST81_10590 [Leptolyngbya sp. 'hensonii']|uniref:hypothetical protein n=1 Tax=Leptolyngbya sp. 'hensonii' TaxID=1922337 RepID=UPI00094FE80B|nr:hypothetical protein [Leptolyngbya sp. 'hensonii']OLP18517.1 hypothetical protein BST81_10590 [Leptolyngbya sp. 'hensonii']
MYDSYYDSNDILEAARTIRPLLSELIGDEAAGAIDPQLAGLLAQANTRQLVDNQILELLAEQDATREWVADFLQDQQQPAHLRTWNPLPGQRSPIGTAKFVCPEGDYTWYCPRIGIEPPLCPTHNLPLDPA